MISPIHYWGTAWFTINAQRYGKGNYYDMIDWVYDDDVEIPGINTNRLSKVLELSYLLELGQDTTPIRDMFAALFFVSVGALMNITLLPAFIVPALVLVGISISAKFFTVFLVSRSQGLNTVTSLRTGFGLSSSGGELALVAAKGGSDVGVTSSFLLPMVGTMTVITTFMTPYVIKFGWRAAEIFRKERLGDEYIGSDKTDG